jgi:Mitochondrial carrier protein
MSDITVLNEMLAAGPGCAIANGLLNGFETTKVKLQLHNQQTLSNVSQHGHHLSTKPASYFAMSMASAGNSHSRMLHAPRPTIVVYPNATMLGVMRQIASEEGVVRGLLTPGLSASLTRSTLYGAYRVGLYPTVRDSVGRAMHNDNNGNSQNSASVIRQRIFSGMITGGLGSLVSCPLDVVRTRMVRCRSYLATLRVTNHLIKVFAVVLLIDVRPWLFHLFFFPLLHSKQMPASF